MEEEPNKKYNIKYITGSKSEKKTENTLKNSDYKRDEIEKEEQNTG